MHSLMCWFKKQNFSYGCIYCVCLKWWLRWSMESGSRKQKQKQKLASEGSFSWALVDWSVILSVSVVHLLYSFLILIPSSGQGAYVEAWSRGVEEVYLEANALFFLNTRGLWGFPSEILIGSGVLPSSSSSISRTVWEEAVLLGYLQGKCVGSDLMMKLPKAKLREVVWWRILK